MGSKSIYNWFIQLDSFLLDILECTTFCSISIGSKIFALLLISGTFPVIVTGILQYFFNLNGPFELFNGLITWYQRPIVYWGGLTGLFSNPNYAGAWLNIVWPFSIASLSVLNRNKPRIYISYFFLFSIAICLILTNSRNAWGGLIIAIPFVVGINSFYWLIPLISFIGLILVLTTFPSFQGVTQEYLRTYLPKRIWSEFSPEGFESIDISRIGIWRYALKFISNSPFFGYGAESFPIIFEIETSFWKGHSHNIFLDIANSYGIPASFILCITILFILLISWRKIYLNSNYKSDYEINYFERAWWTSFFVLLISQLVDIQYFDGRISISFWVLLAGLKNILSKDIKINANQFKRF